MRLFDAIPVNLPAGIEARLDALMQAAPGDGLPLIPPTHEAVRRTIAASGRTADAVLGVMAPLMQECVLADAAVCAVAAGCKPEYFPVVLAALEALLDPEFNLLAVQATTELASTLLIVNGPIVQRLGMHSGSGCLGPGFRANATIGRAVRLATMHIGGAIPGETDMATFGHAGKFTACFAEAEAASPWEPLHVARGHAQGTSAVTVVGADAPVNVNDFASASTDSLLHMIAQSMAYPGSNNAQGGGEVLVVLSPGHAELFTHARMKRHEAQAELHARARIPLERFSPEVLERVRKKRFGRFGSALPDALPVADDPQSILLAVAGGPGSHTLFFPTYGETRAITRVITEAR